MKQIEVCLDRFFTGKNPLKAKWQVRTHPQYQGVICLFHYHHLVLVYNVQKNVILKEWWERPADKRGLDAAKKYLLERGNQNGTIKSG